MRHMSLSATAGDTRSESEIGFVLRAAKRRTGPEVLRHVAAANAGPRQATAKSAKTPKANKTAMRRKA